MIPIERSPSCAVEKDFFLFNLPEGIERNSILLIFLLHYLPPLPVSSFLLNTYSPPSLGKLHIS